MRDIRAILSLSIIILFIMLLALPAFTLKKPTHRTMNTHIANSVVGSFSLDDKKGSKTQEVFEWLG
jgi:hypothetical protein